VVAAGAIGFFLLIRWYYFQNLKKATSYVPSLANINDGMPRAMNSARGIEQTQNELFNIESFIEYVFTVQKNAEGVKGLPRHQMDVILGMRITTERVIGDLAEIPRSRGGVIQMLHDIINATKANMGRLPPNRKNLAIGIEEMASTFIKEIESGRFDQPKSEPQTEQITQKNESEITSTSFEPAPQETAGVVNTMVAPIMGAMP
jgi:hypothetical protein